MKILIKSWLWFDEKLMRSLCRVCQVSLHPSAEAAGNLLSRQALLRLLLLLSLNLLCDHVQMALIFRVQPPLTQPVLSIQRIFFHFIARSLPLRRIEPFYITKRQPALSTSILRSQVRKTDVFLITFIAQSWLGLLAAEIAYRGGLIERGSVNMRWSLFINGGPGWCRGFALLTIGQVLETENLVIASLFPVLFLAVNSFELWCKIVFFCFSAQIADTRHPIMRIQLLRGHNFLLGQSSLLLKVSLYPHLSPLSLCTILVICQFVCGLGWSTLFYVRAFHRLLHKLDYVFNRRFFSQLVVFTFHEVYLFISMVYSIVDLRSVPRWDKLIVRRCKQKHWRFYK